ncbi:MAG: Cna domain protein, partial [Anaeromyxobacteraceae bacterium]|nr:Cna domain protein [Anaeromyxobacteraceae bacterium]
MRPVLPFVVLASVLVSCGGGSSGTPTPAATYAISGTVTGSVGSGVTLSLSGAASSTTTTGASGSYSFGSLANGSYTVTPSRLGHSFSPASIAVSVNGADAGGKDFTARAEVLAPFEIVTLGATTFGASDLPRVRFWNGSGYSATLAATTPNPLQVAVPLYVDPVTGALASGTVSVTILRPDGTSTTLPGTVTIAAPPDLVGVPAGAVTAAFLEGSIGLLASARAALLTAVVARPAACPLVTPEILAEMADSSARLTVMKTAVEGFL